MVSWLWRASRYAEHRANLHPRSLLGQESFCITSEGFQPGEVVGEPPLQRGAGESFTQQRARSQPLQHGEFSL